MNDVSGMKVLKKGLLIIFSHLTSKKVLLSLTGIIIISLCFYSTVGLLFKAAAIKSSVAEALIYSIVSLFKDFIVAISAIVFALCGIDGLLTWRYGSNTQALTEAIKQTSEMTQNINEKKVIEFINRSPKDFDDGSID